KRPANLYTVLLKTHLLISDLNSKVKVVECVYNGSWEHSPLFGSHESTIHTRTTFDTFQNTGA
ncbi:hypothetical protein ACVO88_002179, partial [Salmonella enterica]